MSKKQTEFAVKEGIILKFNDEGNGIILMSWLDSSNFKRNLWPNGDNKLLLGFMSKIEEAGLFVRSLSLMHGLYFEDVSNQFSENAVAFKFIKCDFKAQTA